MVQEVASGKNTRLNPEKKRTILQCEKKQQTPRRNRFSFIENNYKSPRANEIRRFCCVLQLARNPALKFSVEARPRVKRTRQWRGRISEEASYPAFLDSLSLSRPLQARQPELGHQQELQLRCTTLRSVLLRAPRMRMRVYQFFNT